MKTKKMRNAIKENDLFLGRDILVQIKIGLKKVNCMNKLD